MNEPRLAWWRQLLLALLGPSCVGLIVWPAFVWLMWTWWRAQR